MRHKSGFTLIELVITLSIVALTLAFSGPALGQYIKSQRVKTTARQIYTNLQLARMTAIRENRNVVATFGLVESGQATLTLTRSGEQTGFVQVNFTQECPELRLTSSGQGRTTETITFRPQGTAGGQQTILVRHSESDTICRVVVNTSGGIRFARGETDT